ncbi:histone deacetylation protein Rxt3-domain-containing protein [Gorgonomyces haynaldii]|nr:histone deacetylation protein Rxt3-domain-containing protein [Gorgonomyces haynaldii]
MEQEKRSVSPTREQSKKQKTSPVIPHLKVIPPKQDKVKITLTLKPKSGPTSPERKDPLLDRIVFEPGQRDYVEKLIQQTMDQKKKLKSIVVNDLRLLKTPPGFTESFLGHVVYTGAKSRSPHSIRAADLQLFLLPQFNSKHHYSTIEVRIPAEFLTYRGNIAVRKSAVWGTDIYTDDSDVVAMIIHSGHYRPVDAPDPTPEESQDMDVNRDVSLVVKTPVSGEVKPVIAEAEPQKSGSIILHPDHDLQVILRVLPKLIKYTGSLRYGLDSRGWGASHDGESVQVESVRKIERGSVLKMGRKVFSRQWGEMAKHVTKEEEKEEMTFVFSLKDGEACIKYVPKLMTEWPTHLLNLLHDARPPLELQQDIKISESVQSFTKQDLLGKEKWPLWQIKLLKNKCVMESNGKRSLC